MSVKKVMLIKDVPIQDVVLAIVAMAAFLGAAVVLVAPAGAGIF